MLTRAEKKGLPPDSPFREELTEVRRVAQEALEKTRSFSQALHPTILDDYGLEKAIERYLPAVERQSGIEIHFDKQGSGHIAPGHAIHVYRILQEALNNVMKHAKATKVRVQLSYLPKEFVLEIEDDGAGISGEPHGGLGLIAMRERAQMVGGLLQISGRPNSGTLVTLKGPTE
jgi:signal transduction histidine kinase